MVKNHQYQSASKFYFPLTLFVLLMIWMVACTPMNANKKKEASPFQLFIFPNAGDNRLLHDVDSFAYQSWLDHADLTKAELVLEKESVSTWSDVENSYFGLSLKLTLNDKASRNTIKFLEPDSKVDDTLKGEYSLGCMLEFKNEKAFVVMLYGKRILGGTLRCPTQPFHSHPDMYTVTDKGKVVLQIGGSKAEFDQIISSLKP